MNKLIKIIGIISILLLIILIPIISFLKYDVLGNCFVSNNSYESFILINNKDFEKLKDKDNLTLINDNKRYIVKTDSKWECYKELKVWYCFIKNNYQNSFGNYKIVLSKKNIFGI